MSGGQRAGPTDRDSTVARPCASYQRSATRTWEVCTCLGLLTEGRAARLKEAGAYAYNHNLNTRRGLL